MATLNLTSIEDVSRALKYAVKKFNPSLTLEATCAPGGKVSDDYDRFIVLTQRIKKAGVIVGYVCYRIRRPKKVEEVTFSSYEIYDSSYNRLTSKKFHVSPNAEDAFRSAYKEILERCK